VDAGWIQVASIATSTKLVFFWISALLVVALALWLPFRAAAIR